MTGAEVKDPAASIRARLLAVAQSKGEDYQRILGRFAIERFLTGWVARPTATNLQLRGQRCSLSG